MPEIMDEVLFTEYETIVADLGVDRTNGKLIEALVAQADWTQQGARELVGLVRNYGTAILRNALALAKAMRIEDGELGL